MTEIHNSRIEISQGVYVVDSKKFLDICEERTKDGVPCVLSEGCKSRLELYERAKENMHKV